jgi:hypothetical protein
MRSSSVAALPKNGAASCTQLAAPLVKRANQEIDMFENPRKLNALFFMGIGILLLNSTRLKSSFAGASDVIRIGINLLPIVGVIFLVLGIYRFATKEK